MQLSEFQRSTERTSSNKHFRDKNDEFLNFALGIAGEAGEVADMIKKVVYHGHELDLIKLRNELGDVLWYLAALANSACIELEDIATENIAKLAWRYPNGFSPEASRARVDVTMICECAVRTRAELEKRYRLAGLPCPACRKTIANCREARTDTAEGEQP